jgi:hypothetical protein
MTEAPVGPRQIAITFRLADDLKSAPPDPAAFRAAAHASATRLADEPTEALLQGIEAGDGTRGRIYRSGTWTAGRVELHLCSVYPRMGGRVWAQGSATSVATRFRRQHFLPDRVWAMAGGIDHVLGRLPLIVVRDSSDLDWVRIDDGSHRAVAAVLAGMETAPALIATVPPAINYSWKLQPVMRLTPAAVTEPRHHNGVCPAVRATEARRAACP